MNINPKISMVVGHECTTMKEYDNYNSHRVCHTPHSTPCLLLLFCFLFLLVLSPHLGYVFFSCNPKWCVLMLAFRKKNVVVMFFLKQNPVQTTLFWQGEEKKAKASFWRALCFAQGERLSHASLKGLRLTSGTAQIAPCHITPTAMFFLKQNPVQSDIVLARRRKKGQRHAFRGSSTSLKVRT